ncbi:hypothetical protein ACWCQK_05350 [Streptomyces sp. NPDC002306]
MSSALDTPRGAADLAESLLPPLGNRWLHTQAVAARAQDKQIRPVIRTGAVVMDGIFERASER